MRLIEIAKQPTAENAAIHLNPADNIAVGRVPLSVGQVLTTVGIEITERSAVPAGHKVALLDIAAGEKIVRYGQTMGRARTAILPGDHVHTHNVAFEELTFQYDFPAEDRSYPPLPSRIPTFMGFKRSDGRIGTRNYIAVVAASNCAAHTAELIAR